MAKANWIKESEAAEILGYAPRTLRQYVKSGKLDINYVTINGKFYQYDLNSIERLLNKRAVFVNV